jgi:hypothetical protein
MAAAGGKACAWLGTWTTVAIEGGGFSGQGRTHVI